MTKFATKLPQRLQLSISIWVYSLAVSFLEDLLPGSESSIPQLNQSCWILNACLETQVELMEFSTAQQINMWLPLYLEGRGLRSASPSFVSRHQPRPHLFPESTQLKEDKQAARLHALSCQNLTLHYGKAIQPFFVIPQCMQYLFLLFILRYSSRKVRNFFL